MSATAPGTISLPPYSPVPGASNKIAAGICGILLGGLGVHKFILGYTGAGLIMLLVTLLTCGIAYPVMHVIGLIEGIIYLCKPDEEFVRVYVDGRKEWF
ncbi:MAG: TM2 domain-containing protein [Verrucomicrobia bacterium]|nr:TM2 domain-containing protein [Verrucomicrobiota bacterium]